ncbi:MAG: hypothetical protein AAGE76_11590 [Pseudomonadota bacterium]
MDRDRSDPSVQERLEREKPLWAELRTAVLARLYPADRQLEQMLDRMERMP